MRHRIAALALVVFALAPLARAQVRAGTWEVSPFAGYLFGGSFPRGSNSLFSSRVDVQNQVTYGIGLGYFINSTVEVEARWSQTQTGFQNPNSSSGNVFGDGEPNPRLADLTIDYYMGYSTFHFGHSHVVPYVTVGMGAAVLNPGPRLDCPPDVVCVNPSTSTRFTAAVGGGMKIYVNRTFGFRVDGRYYSTYLNSHGGCSTFGNGTVHCSSTNSNWLGNGEATGGLVISF